MPKIKTSAVLFCLQLENKVEKYQEDFESISKVIRKEMVRFEKQRVKDFKSTIIHYLESLMNSQQQVNMCLILIVQNGIYWVILQYLYNEGVRHELLTLLGYFLLSKTCWVFSHLNNIRSLIHLI